MANEVNEKIIFFFLIQSSLPGVGKCKIFFCIFVTNCKKCENIWDGL